MLGCVTSSVGSGHKKPLIPGGNEAARQPGAQEMREDWVNRLDNIRVDGGNNLPGLETDARGEEGEKP